MSKQFDYSKSPIMIYNVEKHINLLGKLGVTVGSRYNSSINGFDKTLDFKSLLLNHVYCI